MNNEHPTDLCFLRFLSGELPAEESAAVRRHLAVCRECMELYLDMREMEDAGIFAKRKTALAPLPPYPLPELDNGFGGGNIAAAAFDGSADAGLREDDLSDLSDIDVAADFDSGDDFFDFI